jgi:hypothetical protein
MITRTILAAALAAGTAGAALAEVQVKTPGGVQVEAPAGPVDLNVNVTNDMRPTEAWVGRAVYSSDGKNLGEVAAIADDSLYVDIGGFLGIGETRVLVDNDKLGAVEPDRIVLKLTEAEVKTFPSSDAKPAAPAQ